MYSHMGMKIEEWEDGRVNIGIAVCPSSATTTRGKDTQLSNTKFIVPKSAFVIRPPRSHQSQGVSLTYAHHESGVSDLIIMLSSPQSEDQGHQDQISPLSELKERLSSMNVSSNVTTPQITSSAQEEVAPVSEEINGRGKFVSEVQHNKIPLGESDHPNSPQDTLGLKKGDSVSRKGSSSGESSRKSSDMNMKRVSWVDESEIRSVDSKVRNNSRESKRESGRKSNIRAGNRSPAKKHNGFCLDVLDDDQIGKRSGEKSRIPVISSSPINGDYPTSCEFYRRRMLEECLYNTPSTPADNWYGYSSIQRYAGQKVIKKAAAEQKRLEQDLSNRRKTEIWILGNDAEDYITSPPVAPLRKKTTRLKPMQRVQ